MTTCLFMHNNADYTRLYTGQPSSLNLHNTYMQIKQVALIFTTQTTQDVLIYCKAQMQATMC